MPIIEFKTRTALEERDIRRFVRTGNEERFYTRGGEKCKYGEALFHHLRPGMIAYRMDTGHVKCAVHYRSVPTVVQAQNEIMNKQPGTEIVGMRRLPIPSSSRTTDRG